MANKRINTFNTEEEYDNYIWSAAAQFPNVAFIKELNAVRYEKSALTDYTIYGTTTNSADFTLKVGTKTINCAVEESGTEGVYIFHSSDSMEDIGTSLTWQKSGFYNNKNILSVKKLIINTSNVTSMEGFCKTSNITYFDFSNFNTSIVTNISDLFNGNKEIKSLDLSNFDTSNVINMGYMFMSCSSLTTLDLSNFDMNKVTQKSNMFTGCSALKTIYVKNCDEATQQKILDSVKSINTAFTLSNGVISRP